MNPGAKITDEFINNTVAKGKQYLLFLYKSGPNRNQSPDETKKIQLEHLRYLFGLRVQGKLVLTGPVLDEGDLRGIGIFNASDKQEAINFLESDPAVRAGRLGYEIYKWFGLPGDALPE